MSERCETGFSGVLSTRRKGGVFASHASHRSLWTAKKTKIDIDPNEIGL